MPWVVALGLYAAALAIGIVFASTGFSAVNDPAPVPSTNSSTSSTAPAQGSGVSASDDPDVRQILARNILDPRTGSLWPPPSAPEPVAEAPTPAKPPEPGPCEDELRISGAAYVSPEHGRPLVVFSGPDVQRSGARSVGMRIADKTLTAIYPNVVVLTGDDGAECWIRMYGLHAQEVVKQERKVEARLALKQRREEAKKKAALRKAMRKKKKR